MENQIKMCCGGFYIDDSLSLDGKVLSASGGMKPDVYDPNGDVAEAGGIANYVSEKAQTPITNYDQKVYRAEVVTSLDPSGFVHITTLDDSDIDIHEFIDLCKKGEYPVIILSGGFAYQDPIPFLAKLEYSGGQMSVGFAATFSGVCVTGEKVDIKYWYSTYTRDFSWTSPTTSKMSPITDATSDTLLTQFNTLLSELRTGGYLEP